MAGTPKAATLPRPTSTAIPDIDLDAAMLEGELEDQARDAAMLAGAAGEPVIVDEIPTTDESFMLDAARGRKVAPEPRDYKERKPQQRAGGETSLGVWDGVATRFQLAHPLMRNVGELLDEGMWTTFNVNFVVDAHGDPTGEFIGTGGPDDESGTVATLYRNGMFRETRPAILRDGRQAAIDVERGVYESHVVGSTPDGSNITQEPMLSLAQPDGNAVRTLFRKHRGLASASAMRAAERMAATAGQEAPGSRGPLPQRSE